MHYRNGLKYMPSQKIIAEDARVALAHQEFEQSANKIRRMLKARSAILKRQACTTDERSLYKICEADPEIQQLVAKLDFGKVWRDFVIDFHCMPAIEEDGRIRWSLPDGARRPN
jgi:hypothetical protein